MRAFIVLVLPVLLFAAPPKEISKESKGGTAKPKESAADAAKYRKTATEFFSGPILKISMDLSDKDIQELRDDPRHYVEGELRDGGKTFKSVGIKLKGASGSFKPVDEKPCFTLNFDK